MDHHEAHVSLHGQVGQPARVAGRVTAPSDIVLEEEGRAPFPLQSGAFRRCSVYPETFPGWDAAAAAAFLVALRNMTSSPREAHL